MVAVSSEEMLRLRSKSEVRKEYLQQVIRAVPSDMAEKVMVEELIESGSGVISIRTPLEVEYPKTDWDESTNLQIKVRWREVNRTDTTYVEDSEVKGTFIMAYLARKPRMSPDGTITLYVII